MVALIAMIFLNGPRAKMRLAVRLAIFLHGEGAQYNPEVPVTRNCRIDVQEPYVGFADLQTSG
jgi:hypothetical protein